MVWHLDNKNYMSNINDYEKKQLFSAQDMVLIAVFSALITICSFIEIPIGPIPFTLQTFGVFVSAGILGTKRGTSAVVVYILIGLIGIPVFRGSGGPAVLAGTTGGYITGFIFTALIIGGVMSAFKKYNANIRFAMTIVGMIIGDAVCFVVGTIQFMAVTNMNLATSLAYCVIPFIIPDMVKIIVAAIFVDRVRKYGRIFD